MSITTTNDQPVHHHVHRRQPDLILRPYEEGIDFTIRLIYANPTAKVVEMYLLGSGNATGSRSGCRHHWDPNIVSTNLRYVFQAIIGYNSEEEYDEDVNEHFNDEMNHTTKSLLSSNAGAGLNHLECLTLIGNIASNDENNGHEMTETLNSNPNDRSINPSCLKLILRLLNGTSEVNDSRRSNSGGSFERLCLLGVNLQGTIMEHRALAESFRIHPTVRYVVIDQCYFTNDQNQNMNVLEDAFREEENTKNAYANPNSKKILVLNLRSKSSTTNDGHKSSWIERLFQSCFCW